MRTLLRLLVLTGALAASTGSAIKQQQPQPAPEPQGGATCETACWHYLECKGLAGNPAAEHQCATECNARGVTQAELDQYVMLDCPTAIQVVEGGGETGAPATGDPGAGACNADCHGCVWDGSTCYYHAASGAGVVTECSACC